MESNPLAEPLVVGPDALVVVGEAALDQGHLGGIDGERGGDLGLGEAASNSATRAIAAQSVA